MTISISQNVGIVAANATSGSQANTGPQAAATTGQAVDQNLAAQLSKVAAQEGSVKIELSEKKIIQREKRAEGAFNPEKDGESTAENGDGGAEETQERKADAYSATSNRRAPLDLTV